MNIDFIFFAIIYSEFVLSLTLLNLNQKVKLQIKIILSSALELYKETTCCIGHKP